MSTNDIILAIFCALLVVYSLVVALVVPKRNPEFPRRLGAFFLVSAVLVGGMLSVVEFFGGEAEPVQAAEPAEPGAPAEPGTGGGEPRPPRAIPPPERPCSSQLRRLPHALGRGHEWNRRAESRRVGPDFGRRHEQVVNGGGAMPPFGGTLDEQQINDVAAYVAQASSG